MKAHLIVLLTAAFLPFAGGLILPSATLKIHRGASPALTDISSLRAGNVDDLIEKDYAEEAAGLFGNIRIPAALFAGASAGAAFALPLGIHEPMKVAMVKRIYALMMMGALSSEIVAVVVSTLTMGALSTQTEPHLATSLRDYLRNQFDLEWVGARIHFLGGVLLFSVATGLRAWIFIACPVTAKAALGIIASSTVLCLSFLSQLEGGTFSDGFVKLPLRYVKALLQRSRHSKMFAASLLISLATTLYIIGNVSHVYSYLLTQ